MSVPCLFMPGTGIAIVRIETRSDSSERVESCSPKATKCTRNNFRQCFFEAAQDLLKSKARGCAPVRRPPFGLGPKRRQKLPFNMSVVFLRLFVATLPATGNAPCDEQAHHTGRTGKTPQRGVLKWCRNKRDSLRKSKAGFVCFCGYRPLPSALKIMLVDSLPGATIGKA